MRIFRLRPPFFHTKCSTKIVAYIGLTMIITVIIIIAIYHMWINGLYDNNNDYVETDKRQFFDAFFSIPETNYCPQPPENLVGLRSLNLNQMRMSDIVSELALQGIGLGGSWEPRECIPRHNIAILVPYRDRIEHLKAFLLNMHPLFAKHKISYKIYLIEPYGNITFNRGLLFNIGFIESNKDSNNLWQCHAYHDVDLISENDQTIFECPDMPFHLAHYISKHNYSINYPTYFGGATIMKKEHYNLVNGYSNCYFGWGLEDDDHRRRVFAKNLTIINPKFPIGRYYMFKHDKANANPLRRALYYSARKRFDDDGLNTVKYRLMETAHTPLYTKFVVYYDEKEYMKNLALQQPEPQTSRVRRI